MARLAVCTNHTSQTFWMNSWRRRSACKVLIPWTVYSAAPVNKKDYSLSAGRHLLKFGKSYYKLDTKIQSTNSARVPYSDQKLKAQELIKHVLSFNSRPSLWWVAPRPCPLWKALPRPLVSRCFRFAAGQSWEPPHPLISECEHGKNPNVRNSVSWGCEQCLWHPPGRLPTTPE
jgi:hypothetical protein